MNYNFWGLDITMCFGKDCPIKNDCIRYVAKPEKYQSYFEESPYNDGKCTCYRDYREYDEKYEGYDSLLNWLQDYDNLLEMVDDIVDCYYNPEKDEVFLSNIGEYGDLTEDEIDELFEESLGFIFLP